MSLADRVIDANRSMSQRLQRWLDLPDDKTLWRAFEVEAHDRIRSLPDGSTVVDVGGGRRCVYHHALRPSVRLIATDVSAEELALNSSADEAVVADVSDSLPLAPQSADLIVSRAVLEHVSDLAAAAENMATVLKPGGSTLHLLPGRFSLFAIVARLLPFKPLIAVLHRVLPETVDQVEFDVFYDRGTPSRVKRAFEQAGFRDVSVEVTWAQPGYFEPVFPAFLLYSVYEWLVRSLRIRSLAAYMVVRAIR
jgi:SAM-dependent methyltransferase